MVTIGVDEVGRGCWAGPLVAAAVYFYRPTGPDQKLGPQLADSKQISARRREQAFELIVAQARVGLGWVSPQTIDQLGLTQAQTQAMDQALANLGPDSTPSQIIVDGVINYLAHYPTSRVQPGADRTVPTVMAASIVAKVVRDRFCQLLDRLYPNWGLARHKGYGTADHRQRLTAQQPVAGLHRFSYRPVARAYQT